MGVCLSASCRDALAPDFGLRGTYRLLKGVGRGMEGEVWVGEDVATGRKFALKCIPRGMEDWQARSGGALPHARGACCCDAAAGSAVRGARGGAPLTWR